MEENNSNIHRIRKFRQNADNLRSDLYIQKQNLTAVLPSIRVPEWMAIGLRENFKGNLARMTRDFYRQQLSKIGVNEPKEIIYELDEELK